MFNLNQSLNTHHGSFRSASDRIPTQPLQMSYFRLAFSLLLIINTIGDLVVGERKLNSYGLCVRIEQADRVQWHYFPLFQSCSRDLSITLSIFIGEESRLIKELTSPDLFLLWFPFCRYFCVISANAGNIKAL
jgi:hypothetical protein